MTQPTLLDLPAPEPEKPNSAALEKRRLSSNCFRVLNYLKAHGSATNSELCEVAGIAAVRRVWDLTQDGWRIDKEHVKGGIWKYTLRGYR